MLVVIEFLGTGIIADRLNKGGFKNLKNKSAKKSSEDIISEAEDISDSDESTEEVSDDENGTDLPEFKKLSKIKVPKETLLDKLKKKFKKDDDDEEEDETVVSKPTIFDEILDDVEPYEQEPEAEEAAVEEQSAATEESAEPAAQSSILTQEEFAALTTPADELEWPGLPPQPKSSSRV